MTKKGENFAKIKLKFNLQNSVTSERQTARFLEESTRGCCLTGLHAALARYISQILCSAWVSHPESFFP
jgi:hypothetical protein